MNILKKISKKLILCLILIPMVSTYFVGSYFVNYALVANSGGENRPSSEMPSQEDEIIEQRQTLLEEKRDQWLQAIDDLTESVTLKTRDELNLEGHIYRQKEPSHQWMIIVHGYQSSEKRSQTLAASFYDLGYNVVTYSLRGHAPSEGKYITMGSKDADDLTQWINHVITIEPAAKITLHGTSMGGATVLNVSGQDLPPQVKTIIDDCGYANLWDIFSDELKLRFNLPSFPVLYMADIMGNIKAGIDISSINPIENVEKSTLPMMFIHTTGDDFIPYEMTEAMYQAKQTGNKEQYIIEGFGHGDAVFADEAYFEKIDDFIKSNQ